MLGFFNCRVTLVPPYDAATEDAIIKTAKLNDALYLQMQELKEPERKYESFLSKYMEIELEINSILMKTKARDHNKDLLVIAENLQKLFVQFKNDHKTKVTLMDADILLNKAQINATWTALLVAEEALKRQK
jgi:hypothetical protein